VIPAFGQGAYVTRITSANQVQVTLTNHGSIGNGFTNRNASLEYPAGSGLEHLVRAGLWVGAHAIDAQGAFTGVTMGAADGSVGVSGTSMTEFTPLENSIEIRSSVPTSIHYHPDATSDEDMIAMFCDSFVHPTSYPQVHRPLRIEVRQVAYGWAAPAYSDFVVTGFVITNRGSQPLTELWVGLYAELASGNKSAQANWPPSGWFSRQWLQYDADQRLVREHYCAAAPAPGSCQLEAVPAWVGVQLLTAPLPGQQVTLGAWPWGGSPDRDTDIERYGLMSAGGVADLSGFDPGDPSELLALGPFTSLAPGDSLEVAFALVGGASVDDIRAHALNAQRTHDAGYSYAVGVPPTPARGGLSLAAVANPVRGSHARFRASAAGSEPARLELLDLSGRRLDQRVITSGGERLVTLGDPLAPGVYFARLVRGREAATLRLVILGP
jgi:hypothetical protein